MDFSFEAAAGQQPFDSLLNGGKSKAVSKEYSESQYPLSPFCAVELTERFFFD